VNDATKHKLKWGWLRLFLALVQISLVPMAVGSLLTLGLHPLTWFCVLTATSAAIVSRLLYRGQSDPDLRAGKSK
jgi:hypothetical protein